MKPSREIRDLVLGFVHDFANADPNLTELFSNSDVTVFIGTDPAEFITGGREARALLAKQVGEIGKLKIDPGTIAALEEGNVGWASHEMTASLPGGGSTDIRGTFVFHREDGEWRIVQMHWSIGRANVAVLGRDLTTAIEELADLVNHEQPELAAVTSPEGTVTILFTDIEGSTATNESLGDDAFLPLLLKHHEIVRNRTEWAGGTVVKSQGDGFMLAFSSARRGVECAVAIQRDVSAFDIRFKVRMGLHTGEPHRHVGDFYGRDVAYAARIAGAAQGGEILVSSLVKSLVEPSGSVLFERPRDLELKGFEGSHRVFSVGWSSS